MLGREPNHETRPSRIIVADEHPLYRDALRRMLSGRSDLQLAAEAADGQEALELCRRLRPDLVLMDVRMPKMDGLAATHAIKQELPRTIVLILTALKDPNLLSEALKMGADGYILKRADQQQIVGAIQKVLRGESPLDQELATQLLLRLLDGALKEEAADFTSGRPFEERTSSPLLESLTPREVEVLRLLVRGQTNQEIARNLLVSMSTVKKHMRRIIAKLGVSSRTQAAIRAIELGLRPERRDNSYLL